MSIKNFKYNIQELSRTEAGLDNEESIQLMDGVYVFIIEGCYSCLKMVEQLNIQDVDYSNWKFVQVLGSIDYFMDVLDIDDTPVLRYYQNGIIRYEAIGILFPPQIRLLKEAMNKSEKEWSGQG